MVRNQGDLKIGQNVNPGNLIAFRLPITGNAVNHFANRLIDSWRMRELC